MSDLPPLPEGFVLQGNRTTPPLPEGFVMQPPEDKSYTGMILPISVDAQGNKRFDSNAGLLGAIKDAFTLPGDAMAGKVQPGNLDEVGVLGAYDGRVPNFALTVSPANPGIQSGDRVIPGVAQALVQGTPEVPTSQMLRQAGSAGYKQMRNMGVDYSSESVANMAAALRAGLDEDGLIAETAPKTASTLAKLLTPPEGSVAPISGLESSRKAFGKIGQGFDNPSDQEAARRVREGIDQFILAADPETVVAGPAADAGAVLREARANTAAYKRSDRLDRNLRDAELNAAGSNSGQNFGNALRQQVKTVLRSDKKSAGYNADELSALRDVVDGSVAANSTRFVGNLLGGGGGLGAIATGAAGAGALGAATGNVPATVAGALLPALGFATKKVSNYLTEKAFNEANELTRMRSPLYEAMVREAPMEVVAPSQRAALIRALLLQQRAENEGN